MSEGLFYKDNKTGKKMAKEFWSSNLSDEQIMKIKDSIIKKHIMSQPSEAQEMPKVVLSLDEFLELSKNITELELVEEKAQIDNNTFKNISEMQDEISDLKSNIEVFKQKMKKLNSEGKIDDTIDYMIKITQAEKQIEYLTNQLEQIRDYN